MIWKKRNSCAISLQMISMAQIRKGKSHPPVWLARISWKNRLICPKSTWHSITKTLLRWDLPILIKKSTTIILVNGRHITNFEFQWKYIKIRVTSIAQWSKVRVWSISFRCKSISLKLAHRGGRRYCKWTMASSAPTMGPTLMRRTPASTKYLQKQ